MCCFLGLLEWRTYFLSLRMDIACSMRCWVVPMCMLVISELLPWDDQIAFRLATCSSL
jgi:hypothetical protein